MNINGLSCGIDLYLGKSVLMKDNILSKIRWTNYDLKLQKYHGSIENKEEIYSNFRKKMKENNSENMQEMIVLLNHIFGAFQIS